MSLSTNNVINHPVNINNEHIFRVIKETLYPSATDHEVMMILDYCRAKKIDPMQKPIHLVEMSFKTNKKDSDGKYIYERKNVIMPGIALYRIDASRSGQYAGMSEPEFGEDITEEFGKNVKKKVTYPKWCRIIVKKILPNGTIGEFPAKEYWKENYATKSNFDDTPNTMWEKRAYGQLAKCTEAQALRKAFPDVVGNEYTKEEMEGKTFIENNNYIERNNYDNYKKIDNYQVEQSDPEGPMDEHLREIQEAKTSQQLQEIFTVHYKYWVKAKSKKCVEKIIIAKDKRKNELLVEEFNEEIDGVTLTGEVI